MLEPFCCCDSLLFRKEIIMIRTIGLMLLILVLASSTFPFWAPEYFAQFLKFLEMNRLDIGVVVGLSIIIHSILTVIGLGFAVFGRKLFD